MKDNGLCVCVYFLVLKKIMLPVFFISMNVVRISNKINVIQILPCTSSAFKYFHICSTDKNFTVQLHTCGAGLLQLFS